MNISKVSSVCSFLQNVQHIVLLAQQSTLASHAQEPDTSTPTSQRTLMNAEVRHKLLHYDVTVNYVTIIMKL